MNLLGRALDIFAPETALRREVAKKRLASVRSFEAAGKGPRLTSWGTSQKSTQPYDLKTIRERARFLVRNNPYAKSALRALTGYVVGKGIKPHSSVPEVEALLKSWADSLGCDYFREQTLYGIQATILSHLMVDGEVFVQRIQERDGLRLRILEVDQLDELQSSVGEKSYVQQGIEYDQTGRKIAYYFLNHSDSFLNSRSIKTQSKRIPADDVVHIFHKESASQTRGYSWFAPVVLRIKDLDEYEDAELLRQKIAACFVGFYRDLEPQGDDIFTDNNGAPKELVPGSILSAPSGQTIEFANPPQTVAYGSFTDHAKMTIAAGVGVPYMMLSGDYSKANYSSSRMSMLNFYRHVGSIQENILLPSLRRIGEWLLDTLELTGAQSDQSLVWAVPPREYVDPVKDVEAARAAVEAGFRSHADILRELGSDPQDVYAEIAENNQQLEKIGINFGGEKKMKKERDGIGE